MFCFGSCPVMIFSTDLLFTGAQDINNINIANLKDKEFLSNEVVISALIIAKEKKLEIYYINFSKNVRTNHLIDIKDQFWTEEI